MRKPKSRAPVATIREAAKLTEQCDCAIPVVRTDTSIKRLASLLITDRDIACRVIGRGKAADTQVRECTSSPLATVNVDDTVEECWDQRSDSR